LAGLLAEQTAPLVDLPVPVQQGVVVVAAAVSQSHTSMSLVVELRHRPY
jgi:hypothetical protein